MTTQEYDINQIAICVCRDGANGTGSMLTFHETKQDVYDEISPVMQIQFRSIDQIEAWFRLNLKMIVAIRNGLGE